VNLTNSYDKPEKNENAEKMKELGKFAKVNIPEFDEKVCVWLPCFDRKCCTYKNRHNFRI
jgi:hypothetical protein